MILGTLVKSQAHRGIVDGVVGGAAVRLRDGDEDSVTGCAFDELPLLVVELLDVEDAGLSAWVELGEAAIDWD